MCKHETKIYLTHGFKSTSISYSFAQIKNNTRCFENESLWLSNNNIIIVNYLTSNQDTKNKQQINKTHLYTLNIVN